MSDIAVTAANVLPGTGAVTPFKASDVFGEAVTAGMAVYRKASDNKIYKAVANATSAEAACIGIARNGGSAGQPAIYQSGGVIAIGGTTVAGTIYCASAANAGGICPWGDLASTNLVTIIGVGDGSGNIKMNINASAVPHA